MDNFLFYELQKGQGKNGHSQKVEGLNFLKSELLLSKSAVPSTTDVKMFMQVDPYTPRRKQKLNWLFRYSFICSLSGISLYAHATFAQGLAFSF